MFVLRKTIVEVGWQMEDSIFYMQVRGIFHNGTVEKVETVRSTFNTASAAGTLLGDLLMDLEELGNPP